MKLKALLTENLNSKDLLDEYQEGIKVGNLRVGQNYLFFKSGFSTYFIPYSGIYRYFRRIKLVPARMCCAKMDLEIEYLVLCDKKKELAEIQLPNKRAAVKVMDLLKQRMPNVKVGINKNQKKQINKLLKGEVS